MASSGWKITGQVPDQYSPVAAGQPVIGTIISFVTSDGNQGSLFVPDDQYTTAKVRALVEAKANLVDNVAKQAERYKIPE